MAKVRCDAKLKSLPAPLQVQVWDILKAAGITPAAMQRIRQELGVPVGSIRTLSEFYHWYDSPGQRIAREIETAGSVTALVVERMRQNSPVASEEELFRLGQRIFAERAIALQDPDTWVKTQAAGRDKEKVVLKGQELALAQQKFQRETCEMFIKWAADEQARSIANSGATHADKIERLGQLMFGEGWR
jgi:hypothetical protein